MSPWDLFKNCNIFVKNRTQLFRAKISYTIGRNPMKPCYRGRIYICSLCTWVLVFSRGEKCSHGTYSKIAIFSKIELSFSALDLLYYFEESNETLHRGRIYVVVVHLGIGFLRATKYVPMGLVSIFRARSPILLGGIK